MIFKTSRTSTVACGSHGCEGGPGGDGGGVGPPHPWPLQSKHVWQQKDCIQVSLHLPQPFCCAQVYLLSGGTSGHPIATPARNRGQRTRLIRIFFGAEAGDLQKRTPSKPPSVQDSIGGIHDSVAHMSARDIGRCRQRCRIADVAAAVTSQQSSGYVHTRQWLHELWDGQRGKSPTWLPTKQLNYASKVPRQNGFGRGMRTRMCRLQLPWRVSLPFVHILLGHVWQFNQR
jgi:hypothetical protein